MMPIARKVGAVIANVGRSLALLALALPAAAATGPESDSETAAARATVLIGQIPTVPDEGARADMVCQLPRLAGRIDQADLGAHIIDGLVGLLADSSDWVVMCAANALVAIGSPAQRALPAIEEAGKRAFKEEYPDNPAVIVETGFHTWHILAMAAAQLKTPGIETGDAVRNSFVYMVEWSSPPRAPGKPAAP
jgi:hypothetical protein